MPRGELSDAQKGDLSKLWAKNSEGISPNQLMEGSGDSCPPSDCETTASMDDHTYEFIVRLYFFLSHIVSCACTDHHQKHYSQQQVDQKNVFMENKSSPTLDAIQHLIAFHKKPGNHPHDDTLSFYPKPCYMTLNQTMTLWFNHASFLSEMDSLETTTTAATTSQGQNDNHSSSFGQFLYHRPESALLALNCTMGLLWMTLYRNHQRYIGNHTVNQVLSSEGGIQTIPSFVSRFFHVYPQLPLKDMKTSNVAKFISVQGHVIRARPKRLRVVHVQVTCTKCAEQWKIYFWEGRYVAPTRCYNRKCKMKGANAWRIVKTTASYVDFQELKIQEIQEDTMEDAGRTPRTLDIEVTSTDLVDICTAGDTIQVSGMLKAVNTAMVNGRGNKKVMQETSTYKIYMAANCIINTTKNNFEMRKRLKQSKDDTATSGGRTTSFFTSEQLETITKVAYADHMCGPMHVRMAFPFDLLVRSICPAIIGHDMVKAGILLALLGGTPTNLSTGRYGNQIRSNIHILIVGDPGMGKSQMLLAASQVAARSVYIGGNTSSTGGLTVTLTKEPGGEIGIEAGALVIADQGTACIDEFDKMAKSLQDGLLEAMEQQQLSIAKAGVVASLPARCSIIAAANPETGKYNRNKTVGENLSISKPLLSRFDMIYILQDLANDEQDTHVAKSIIRNFRREESHSTDVHLSNRGPDSSSFDNFLLIDRLKWVNDTQRALPAHVIKDYISYAREYCKPKLTQDAADILKQYFMSLRYPRHGMDRSQSIPITTRQLEALIRLSQARAKACLRDFVLKEDAEDVIELMRASVNQIHMRDDGYLDRSRGGASGRSKRKPKSILLDALKKADQNKFSFNDIESIATRCNLPSSDLKQMVDELRNEDPPKLLKTSNMYTLL